MKPNLANHPIKRFSLLIRFLFLTTLVLLSFVLIPIQITNAATITINSTTDVVNANDGLCTLPEAIAAANTDTASGSVFGECIAGAGADIINIPDGSYILPADQTIAGDLIIYGSGAKNTIIDRGWTTEVSTMRIFSITYGTNVSINNVTLKNGYASDTDNGAAIYNNKGIVNVFNCIFMDNRAGILTNNISSGGAIFNNGGNVNVTASTFTGNYAGGQGGAIANENQGSFTIANSLFVNNQSTEGGAIANHTSSVADITNSTFSSNSALNGNGGGINNHSGTITVTNSTFSGNSANSGGGIYNLSTLNISNTIIANSQTGGDCYTNNLITINNNNLIEDATCLPAYEGDPNLGVLADNGGPTMTHALQSNSLNAVDKIPSANCTASPINGIDQRGAARNYDGDESGTNECDIGAYEYRIPEYQFNISGGNIYNIGNVSIQILSGNSSDIYSITVEEMGSIHLAASGSDFENNFWHITANTIDGFPASGYTLNLTLPHNNLPNPQICRYPGQNGGFGWDCFEPSLADDATAMIEGITELSDWTMANDVGPTSTSLAAFQGKSPLTMKWLILGMALIGCLFVLQKILRQYG